MAKLYERYLRLLKNWPLHPDYPPPTRSLPVFLREQGKINFSARGEFSGNAQQCDRRLKSLETLTRNHWANTYPHTRQSGAMGLTAEQCRLALSEEYQQVLETSRIYATTQGLFGAFKRK